MTRFRIMCVLCKAFILVSATLRKFYIYYNFRQILFSNWTRREDIEEVSVTNIVPLVVFNPGSGGGRRGKTLGPNFYRAAKHTNLLSMNCFALIKIRVPTKVSRDFQDKQTTAEYM